VAPVGTAHAQHRRVGKTFIPMKYKIKEAKKGVVQMSKVPNQVTFRVQCQKYKLVIKKKRLELQEHRLVVVEHLPGFSEVLGSFPNTTMQHINK
jgi:hypothetical protein